MRTPAPGWLRTPRAAFTLVELLVVIAIITVLAGILLPVFAAARGKARQAMCTSNMRQVGLALLVYSDDHDGLLPPATTKVPGGRFSAPWQGALDVVWWDLVVPYVSDPRILYCPDALPYLPTYHVNAKLTFTTPGRLDAASQPSNTILIYEGWVPDAEGEAVYIPAGSFVPAEDSVTFCHAGRMNICFADGHIARTSPPDMVKGSWLWVASK